ncbi:MAG: hypothetical protein RMX68_031805 [Aulosira sp. ZfuVER01]|nr:hypothetical protein [Aulosira sp. ZfuVER01]MDZ8000515.1 hypothetical protein [Aulosira sp. DedVER01a]MDZ8056471.1 hypothetical protein [Aulosira sp. ZfuCHP01]
MLEIITESQEIKSCQELMKDILRGKLDKTDCRTIKTRSRTITNIHTIYNDKIWFANSHVNQPFTNLQNQNTYKNNGIERSQIIYWNGFGCSHDHQKIIVEINILCDGSNRRYGGLFAQDSNNNKFLLHTGNVRDKKDAQSLKNWYQVNCPMQWVNVVSQKSSKSKTGQAILVTPLQEVEFLDNIIIFMKRVADIKKRGDS